MIAVLEKGFLNRMYIYLEEMYPFPARLLSSFLISSSFMFLLSKINQMTFSLHSQENILGTVSLFLFMLILRLMDELKDVDIDKQLFSERPLPSGRVLEKDIRFSLSICFLLVVLLHLSNLYLLISALVVLGYSSLMFRYFFIPNILQKNLLLNLATHNPIIPVMLIHMLVIFSVRHHLDPDTINFSLSLLLILVYWLLFFAWEISRKIRAPKDENAYVTYSRIFGRKRAVVIAVCAQYMAISGYIYILNIVDISPFVIGLALVGFKLLTVAYFRFLIKPSTKSSRLKPYVEVYILLFCLSSLLEPFIQAIWGIF
jgi:4-hydroxybenzoate polyprenyltransferase